MAEKVGDNKLIVRRICESDSAHILFHINSRVVTLFRIRKVYFTQALSFILCKKIVIFLYKL